MVNRVSVFGSAITLLAVIVFYRHLSEEEPTEPSKDSQFLLLQTRKCVPQDFGHGSIVCRCNATYCDTAPSVKREDISAGHYIKISSNKNGSRFEVSQGNFTTKTSTPSLRSATPKVNILVDRNVKFQRVEGFGGAFTDATGLNIASVSKPLQETIVRQYFDKEEGLNYTFARVPMGGTDFSIRTYSYDDYDGDESLNHFRLQMEDLKYKIPYLKKALQLQSSLKLIATPWSAPSWMKTNGAFIGRGFLKHKYYQEWANYYIRFLEAYSSHNVSFWGVTTQNEPNSGTVPLFPFNCMGWTPAAQRDWIKGHLGPTMKNSSFSNVNIIMFDDDRLMLSYWSKVILSDPEAAKYVSGIGLHWYLDVFTFPSILDKCHKRFPNKWLLATEASTGFLNKRSPVILGSWERGELYAQSIISDLNHWIVGWMDWNMALNVSGGPNWANNQVDSPIIVDYQQDVIYKQPMFYAMGHFSKFIPAGSVRILNRSEDYQVLSVLSCLRPDGLVVVVILNMKPEEISVELYDTHAGFINLALGPNSIQTIIYYS